MFLQDWWPNQQSQSTEWGWLVIQAGLSLTRLTSPCYNNITSAHTIQENRNISIRHAKKYKHNEWTQWHEAKTGQRPNLGEFGSDRHAKMNHTNKEHCTPTVTTIRAVFTISLAFSFILSCNDRVFSRPSAAESTDNISGCIWLTYTHQVNNICAIEITS